MFIQLHDLKGGAFWMQVRDIRWMERKHKQPEPKADPVECTELLLWIPKPGMSSTSSPHLDRELALKVWVTETPEFINQISRTK